MEPRNSGQNCSVKSSADKIEMHLPDIKNQIHVAHTYFNHSVCLVILDPPHWLSELHWSLWNEMLPEDLEHLLEEPHYRWGGQLLGHMTPLA